MKKQSLNGAWTLKIPGSGFPETAATAVWTGMAQDILTIPPMWLCIRALRSG